MHMEIRYGIKSNLDLTAITAVTPLLPPCFSGQVSSAQAQTAVCRISGAMPPCGEVQSWQFVLVDCKTSCKPFFLTVFLHKGERWPQVLFISLRKCLPTRSDKHFNWFGKNSQISRHTKLVKDKPVLSRLKTAVCGFQLIYLVLK